MAVKVGDVAPDFELSAVIGQERTRFKLADYRGKKNVVLAFYPIDWSPTWSAEMPALNALLPRFAALDAQVVGISTDSIYCHIAWQEKGIGMMAFPLASDYFPHGDVAKKYGVQRLGDPIPGINERSVFVIDKQGKIVFRKLYELGEQPDGEEILEALRDLHAANA